MNTPRCNHRTDASVRWWQHGTTVLGTACVIWFFSEMFFWNEGEHFYFWSTRSEITSLAASIGEWALVSLFFYSFFALWLLVPISVFRVRNIWSLLLAFLSTGILAFGYWLLDRFSPESLITSKAVLIALALVAILLSVVGLQSFVLILAVLVGLTSLVLWRNRMTETAPDILSRFAHTIRLRNYFLLFLMPLVASSLYLIWYAHGISVNEVVAWILYPVIIASVLLIVVSVAKLLSTHAGSSTSFTS